MLSLLRRAEPRQVRVLDGLVLLWCTVWLAVGVGVGYQIWQLARLGGTLSTTGQAIDNSGRALQELRKTPIVGGTTGTIGDDVRRSAGEIVQRGRETQSSTRRLAVLLGLTTTLVPVVPAFLYALVRRELSRDRREVRAMAGRVDDRELEMHLARRALARVPYRVLLRVTPTPEADFAQGRTGPLADAELARLGLRRTPGRS